MCLVARYFSREIAGENFKMSTSSTVTPPPGQSSTASPATIETPSTSPASSATQSSASLTTPPPTAGVSTTGSTTLVSSSSDTSTGSTETSNSSQITSYFPTNNGTASSTSSTSATTTSSIKPKPTHSTISNGAVAGISIATFILGAALALLGFWIFSRRRGSSSRKRRNLPAATLNTWSSPQQSPGGVSSKINGTRTSEISMDDYSPVERLDDSQFRRHMQNLEELIHQHVENHYHNRPYTGRQEELKVALTRCGYTDQTEPSSQTMATLLINPSKRSTAIRSLIGSVILKAVDLKNSPEDSLLPDVITQFYHMIPKKRRANEKDAFNKALARWRQLSAYLLSHNSSHHESSLQPTDPATERILETLSAVLQPFIRPSRSESQSPTQVDNLASIIQEGKEFGMLLLEQPGTWVLGWESASKRSSKMDPRANKEIVVFPSLGEVINRGGRENLRVIVDVLKENI
ncbi:hypothetical protein CJF31_00005035 [Rutstroemia sp. NJR-2017a BVV2]|nr:hypothetical protein CJF31_00005035 [Rutstroemia sp. NJR-2017a BVV2]